MRIIKKIAFVVLPFTICLTSSGFRKNEILNFDSIGEKCSETIINKSVEENLQVLTIQEMSTQKVDSMSSSFEKVISKSVRKDDNGLVYIDDEFNGDLNVLFFGCDEEEKIMSNIYFDFVKKNIITMNDFIANGFGEMDDDGNFVFYDNTFSSYEQQSPLVRSYNFNIFKGHTFIASSEFTMPFAIVGIASNIASIVLSIVGSSKETLNSMPKNGTSVSKLERIFGSANASNLLTAIHSGVAGLSINDCASILLGAISILLTALAFTPSIGWVVSLVLTLLTLYLPNITTSIQLFKNCATNKRDVDVNIGWWWSSYSIR